MRLASPTVHAARRALRGAGGALVLAFVVVAILAPLLAPHDPYAMDPGHVLEPPGVGRWLGTDALGRDVLSRTLHGARISLGVGAAAVSVAVVAGTAIGAIAGYFGRLVDAAISRIVDVLFAFPDVLLALVVVAVLGPSLGNVTLAIGIVYTPIFARVSRSAVLSIARSGYVEAARAIGASDARILARHVLPNLVPLLIVQTSLALAFAVLAEAALGYLGLGVEPDAPSWGMMLQQGRPWFERAWWVAVFPGLAISLLVLGLNLVGDALRDAIDPRSRR